LRDLGLLKEIVSKVVRAVDLPVTAKIRSGWSADELTYLEAGKIIEEAGASAIAIHPRTREQGFTGKADWTAIKRLKEKVKKIKGWLRDNEDKPGKSGKPLKSNITDNDSAKMKSSHGVIQGYDGVAMRERCLRHPDRTEARQVYFFQGSVGSKPETFTQKMKRKIDSIRGRLIYNRRLGTAEPGGLIFLYLYIKSYNETL
jgi:pyridoxine 5'-phosphate synthase PdxJ